MTSSELGFLFAILAFGPLIFLGTVFYVISTYLKKHKPGVYDQLKKDYNWLIVPFTDTSVLRVVGGALMIIWVFFVNWLLQKFI